MTESAGYDDGERIRIESIISSKNAVLKFQRYLARRAWGYFFIMWAAVMLVFLTSSAVIGYFVRSEFYAGWINFAVDFSSFGVALYYVRNIFDKSRNAAALENPSGNAWSSGGYSHYISWILLVSYIFLTFLHVSQLVREIGQAAIFIGFVIVMYRNMKHTFHRVPNYGVVTITSFISGNLIEVALSVFSGMDLLVYLDWGAVILLWMIGSAIALVPGDAGGDPSIE